LSGSRQIYVPVPTDGLRRKSAVCGLKGPAPLHLNPRPRFRALAPAASFRGPQSYRFAFGQKI
jgi:hypothetical protein